MVVHYVELMQNFAVANVLVFYSCSFAFSKFVANVSPTLKTLRTSVHLMGDLFITALHRKHDGWLMIDYRCKNVVMKVLSQGCFASILMTEKLIES